MATYIDTNVVLRLLLNDDPAQRSKGLRALESATTGSVAVLDTVLVEVVFQLESPRSYGIERDDHLPHLVALLQAECFVLQTMTWKALELLAENPKLDYTDCLLIAYARAETTDSVLSFDRELNRIAENN